MCGMGLATVTVLRHVRDRQPFLDVMSGSAGLRIITARTTRRARDRSRQAAPCRRPDYVDGQAYCPSRGPGCAGMLRERERLLSIFAKFGELVRLVESRRHGQLA